MTEKGQDNGDSSPQEAAGKSDEHAQNDREAMPPLEDMSAPSSAATNMMNTDRGRPPRIVTDDLNEPLVEYETPLRSTRKSDTRITPNTPKSVSFEGDNDRVDFQRLIKVENQKKDAEIVAIQRKLDDDSFLEEDLSHESLHSISGNSDDDDSSGPSEIMMYQLGTPSSRPGTPSSRFGQSRRPSIKRVSSAIDLETGQSGGRRARVTMLAQPKDPQSTTARRRRGVRKIGKKLINPFWGHERYDGDDDDSDNSMELTKTMRGRLQVEKSRRDVQQYRLTALGPSQKERMKGLLKNATDNLKENFTIYEDTSSYDRQGLCSQLKCCSPNQWVIRYLHWAFRNGFLIVLLSGLFVFCLLTIGFAVLILAIGNRNPHCVHVNGEDFGTGSANFMDAYALSWTTFSTVGYGLVFPSTSATTDYVKSCSGIFFLMTLESFIGILYASLVGAIVFAKVARAASHAQVKFSDPIVVKFGSGVFNWDDQDDSSQSEDEECGGRERADTFGSQQFTPSKIPCPVLEFRVLNRLHGQQGGEIIDGSMNIVASIDEVNASKSLRSNVRGARRKGKKKRGAKKGHAARASDMSFIEPNSQNMKKMKKQLERIITTSRNQAVEEDPSGLLIPRRIFAKLDTESQEHPFFKRLWMVRHELNQYSPLLMQDAKELIRLNGGHWPKELNNPEGVRASIHFDQILVSLSGTSNVDANSVYAQKIYDYIDLVVGYRFCNILFRERDGTVGVDANLLNDVLEQNGGGGEDLSNHVEASKKKEILIL